MLVMQSFIFSLICGLFLEFHRSLSGDTRHYMWNVRGAPTFSMQDDRGVGFRSHQSKLQEIPLASPPRCTSPNMSNRVNQRVPLCASFLLTHSITQGDSLRWFEPPASRSAMFGTFWEICPIFQRKKKQKTLRTKCLMLNSILCNLCEKGMLFSCFEPDQFYFLTKIKGMH